MVDTVIQHIEITPGICGGRPRIAGSRIRVQDVVFWYEQQGMSADEIVRHYPTITRADVFAALTYYWDHRTEVDREIAADIAREEAFERSQRV